LKSARIQALLRTRPISNGAWAIYAETLNDICSTDLGLAIAKKFAKRAVDRNRLKRVARELNRIGAGASTKNTQRVIKLKEPIGRFTAGKLRNAEYQGLKTQLQGLI